MSSLTSAFIGYGMGFSTLCIVFQISFDRLDDKAEFQNLRFVSLIVVLSWFLTIRKAHQTSFDFEIDNVAVGSNKSCPNKYISSFVEDLEWTMCIQ